MNRKEILRDVKEHFGSVPGFVEQMPDAALQHWWADTTWMMSDTRLSAHEKALVAFGAASAIHCRY